MKRKIAVTALICAGFLGTSIGIAVAGGIGAGKPCSDKDFLKTVKSGSSYFLCAEGNGGLQWFSTKSPAQSKAETNAAAAKSAAVQKYKNDAFKAWAQVANYAGTLLQRAKTYDSGSTGHVFPDDMKALVYNLGISAKNAANAYALAADRNASNWANKATSYASALQSRRNYYLSRGEVTMSSETSILLTYAGSARGYNLIKN